LTKTIVSTASEEMWTTVYWYKVKRKPKQISINHRGQMLCVS